MQKDQVEQMLPNLLMNVSQEEFGSMVGISQQAVSVLCSSGVLPREGTASEMLLAYCERLRQQAAGRLGSAAGGLDLVQERAALAREQRMGIALKNAVTRQEYAPVQLLGEVLGTASQAVSERFEQLPGMLKRACPDLPEAARDQVMATIAAARNEWVKGTVQLVAHRLAEKEEEHESDDEPST